MDALLDRIEQFVKLDQAAAEVKGPNRQAVAALDLWDSWATILAGEYAAIEAHRQAALAEGTLEQQGKTKRETLGDAFYSRGVDILRYLRDAAIRLSVDPMPLGNAMGLIEKVQAGRWEVNSTGSENERLREAESTVGPFFDAELGTCLMMLRAKLSAAMTEQFTAAVNDYLKQTAAMGGLRQHTDGKRAERTHPNVTGDAGELAAIGHLAAADAAATTARETACRCGPPLADKLRADGNELAAGLIGRVVDLLTAPTDRQAVFELRPELLAALDAAGATPAAPATPGRRRAKRILTRKPLTKPQTDALTVYMRCNQNVGAAAVELGISRAAAYDRINAALKKTGDKPLADRAGKSVRAHAMG